MTHQDTDYYELGQQVARQRWGQLPKTFKHNRRDGSGRLLPDDFPVPLGNSGRARVTFQQRVNEYYKVNNYKDGRFPWEDDND